MSSSSPNKIHTQDPLRVVASVTVSPSRIRKIKKKVDGGEELSPAEQKFLDRSRKAYDRVDPTAKTETDPRSYRKNIQNALNKAGIEVEEISLSELHDLVYQTMQDEPLTSEHPVRKAMGSLTKFTNLLGTQRQGLPAALADLASTGDVSLQVAAKKLKPLVSDMMGPLSQISNELDKLMGSLKKLDKSFSTKGARYVLATLKEIEGTYRSYGSDINEQLGPMKNSHLKTVEVLKKALKTRYKAAMQDLRSKGATPEQAAEAAQKLPAIREIRKKEASMKAMASGIDFLIQEFGTRFIASMKRFKELKSDLASLVSLKEPTSRAASYDSLKKRLRMVATKLLVLEYLSNTSH